jgi:Tfp pilus assembly protein PilN
MRAVNLMPSDQGRLAGANVAGRSQGGAAVVIGLLVGLAAMALLYGTAHKHVKSYQSEVAELTQQAAAARERAGQLTPFETFLKLREQRVAAVAQLVDTRFDWPHAFSELARVLPSDTSLSSVSGTVGAAATSATSAASSTSGTVTSATPAGSTPTFTIAGCSSSQSEVALTLQRLRLIQGVQSVTLQSSSKSGSSGGGAASGGCGTGHPTFSAQIVFAGLPASRGATSATATTEGAPR